MSREFAFLFGVHCHQPVGNFGWVFEQAAADCYLPFLKVMRAHPAVRFSAHYSGPLLEYFQGECPEAWDLLGELSSRGQMELLGGGFYEPILSIIPEEDRRGQVEMMSVFLERHFGRKPRGLWLTERVWEPSLASTLSRSGIEFTLLDENHFQSSHLPNLRGLYVTEDQGFSLRLLAIDQKLRYLIPFRDLGELEAYFEEIKAKGGGWAVLGDDGEKFGLWPGTKSWVYERGWLESFLRRLESARITTMTFGEAVSSRPPDDRIYPPPASYSEMMEWVLEPEDQQRFERLKSLVPEAEARGFLKAGSFPDFFRKYPESRHLRDRMLGISRLVRKAGPPEALPELYRGQGNDPYWHGVFGGLYLPHLREAAYEHLLKAEALCPGPSEWTTEDQDLDGRDEYVWRDERFGMRVEARNGGGLTEIDYFPLFRNLTDVLSRRRESYHRQSEAGSEERPGREHSIHELAKSLPAGSERLTIPDPGPRRSAMVRFFESETGAESFFSGEAPDLLDLSGGYASARIEGRRLICEQAGRLAFRAGDAPIVLRKEFIPLGRKIQVAISIRNESPARIRSLAAVEWNLYQYAEEMERQGNHLRLCRGSLVLAGPEGSALRSRPLETLSQSEKGFDTIHQGYAFIWAQEVEIGPGEEVYYSFELGEPHAV